MERFERIARNMAVDQHRLCPTMIAIMDPITFAAGVYLLDEAQAAELESITAPLEAEGADAEAAIRAMEAAAAFIRANVDGAAIAETAQRIRRGQLRVPLYDADSRSVIGRRCSRTS